MLLNRDNICNTLKIRKSFVSSTRLLRKETDPSRLFVPETQAAQKLEEARAETCERKEKRSLMRRKKNHILSQEIFDL